MDAFEAQVDHYKDTCDIQRKTVKARNRLFILVWIDVFALYLFLISQNEAISAIQGWMKEKLGVDSAFSPSVFLCLCWVLLLYFCMRYIQTNVKIERDYVYISKIEKEIESKGCAIFNREGDAYLDKYPFILNYIDFLYKWFFPVLITVAVIIKIILEILAHQSIIGLIVDSFIAIAIIILWISYLAFILSICKNNTTSTSANSTSQAGNSP